MWMIRKSKRKVLSWARTCIYKALRKVRRERDYEVGALDDYSRPYTFRSVKFIDNKPYPQYITTTEFMKTNPRICSRLFNDHNVDYYSYIKSRYSNIFRPKPPKT